MALVQSVRRPATIAGFPLSAWAFALRMWAATSVNESCEQWQSSANLVREALINAAMRSFAA